MGTLTIRLGDRMKESDSEFFFHEANMKRLEESEQQFREGKVIVKTMQELEAMEKIA